MKRVLLSLLLCLSMGCTALNYPHIWVVRDRTELGGSLGMYCTWNNTIYLAPGANEVVFWHEWRHFQGATEEEINRR